MKYALFILCLAGCLTLQSCGVLGIQGALYQGTTFPSLDLEVQSDANVKPSKTGEASCSSILGLIAVGDCGVQAAMKAGGISKIHSADIKYTNILGLYAKQTLIVTGE